MSVLLQFCRYSLYCEGVFLTMKITFSIFFCLITPLNTFWDMGTTTIGPWWRWDESSLRTSRFRWQRTESSWFRMFYPWFDWEEIEMRRRLYMVAGISFKMINLSTAAILNRRTVITSANFLDPYMNDALTLRVWALGRTGAYNTPFRYRVWRITRILPKSLRPEHQHGPWGYHTPIHDIAIIHTLDQMYIYGWQSGNYHYAYRAHVPTRTSLLTDLTWFAGCGFEYLRHVQENYKIFYSYLKKTQLKSCATIIPKNWGKFICFDNTESFPCVQNGGPLFDYDVLIGIGCFEIRRNDEKLLVFTDLRYYMANVAKYAVTAPGEYYEYAYPQWSVRLGFIVDTGGSGNDPYIPTWHVASDIYPLGRK